MLNSGRDVSLPKCIQGRDEKSCHLTIFFLKQGGVTDTRPLRINLIAMTSDLLS